MLLYLQRIINRLSLLIILLCALMGWVGLHPAVIQAEGALSQPQRHYRADQTPPGLTAPAWQQIVSQINQQAYLKASNPEAGDFFSYSVVISGDTLVVGAPGEDSNATGVNDNQADNSASNAGAAYVFIRSGNTWSQQAYLKASNTEGSDIFGHSVAISGDTLVVGAPHERSSVTGVNGDQSDNSAPFSGAAYVFIRSGNIWSQQAYLKASNAEGGDEFGWAVAVSGDTIVVGAPSEDSNATGVNGNQTDNSARYAGAAYIFTRNGNTWGQQAYLKASNAEGGEGISLEGDRFGWSVAISIDTVVVGAYDEDSNATGVNGDQVDNSAPDAGAAYIFTRSGNIWSQQAYLKASNAEEGDQFGRAVAVSGDTVAVGAWHEDSSATGVNGNQADNSALDAGAAYVFTRSGNIWSQQAYLKASNAEGLDEFGGVLAMSGDTIAITAPGEGSSAVGVNGNQGDNSAPYAGAVYLFARSGSVWSQQAYLKASNTEKDDIFGISVAITDDTVAVGSWFEDSNATGANGNQADNSVTDAGAAYVFLNVPVPEIAVLGNTVEIASGDTTPSLTDHTDFDSIALGGAITRTFTISNSGAAALNLTGSPLVSITGLNAGDFSLVGLPISPVASNTTTSFQVRFKPPVVGTRVVTLTLANNDSDENPYTFAIRGSGVASSEDLSTYLPLILK